MNLHQLKLFRDLSIELSFVRVAQINHLTQPAVSLQIKNLEAELGIAIFERAPRRVALTEQGRALLPLVEDILKSCANLRSLSAGVAHHTSGDVRIASIHSIGMYELGAILRRFLQGYPRIHVRLQYLQAAEIYDLVLRKKLDLGIVAYPHSHHLIDVIPFGSDSLTLVVPHGHRLAQRNSIRLQDLSGEPFIAFDEGIPTREAIDELLKEQGVRVDVRMTNDNVYAIKSAVQANLGIAFVPSLTVEEEVRRGLLHTVSVRGMKTVRPRAIIVRKKHTLTKAAQIFLREIRMYTGRQ